MSLTWKLILGFLFALVLQVAQMLISGYFTAQMQTASLQVASALEASIAVQGGVDASRELQRLLRAADGTDRPPQPNVYRVYLDEMKNQAATIRRALGDRAPAELAPAAPALARCADHLRDLESALTAQLHEPATDAAAFLGEAAGDVEEALLRTQVAVRELGTAGVAAERDVHDLPVRAGLAITLGGVMLMAAFVAWFSRQLVLPIERAWAQLEQRVQERTIELAQTVGKLQEQIVETRRVEAAKEQMHQQLVDASRRAGMAELANGVLHNVGNVLNSVNVSANLLLGRLRQSKADGLQRAVDLVRQHEGDLAEFLLATPQGKVLPKYLGQLAEHLRSENQSLLAETTDLTQRIDHMKEIVSRQQAYARTAGTTAAVRLGEVVDDVLRMHKTSFAELDIRVEKNVAAGDQIETDRSRVMQILMNLVANARQALRDQGRGGGVIEVTVAPADGDRVRVVIRDNGPGIEPANLTRVFALGFTTKKDGHGFGLHHSANAAAEMNGRLWAESEGPGKGATFVLELPMKSSGATRTQCEVSQS
jgi:signal transduction histidine kinase